VQRQTRQRQAIRQAFEQAGRPLSPQEALEAAQRDVPGLGIATVYRTIKALLDQEVLATVQLPGEPDRYELAELPHHHHFHCTACDRVFDLAGCAVRSDLRLPRGFEARSHEIIFTGLCPDCH
jgi:Fur family transcriptional regulator, ferric uptake regulator